MTFLFLFFFFQTNRPQTGLPIPNKVHLQYSDTIITDTIPGPIYHPKTIDPDNKIFTESTFSKFVKKVKGTPPFIPDVVGKERR